MELLFVGILLGLDNFILSIGLGTLSLSKNRKVQLLALFVLAEVLLPVVGLAFGQSLAASAESIESLQWISMLLFGLWIGVTVLFRDRFTGLALSNQGYLLFLLPLIFGLDNLLGGVAFHNLGVSVLVMGVLSAVICALGLVVGEWLNTRTPLARLNHGILGGFYMVGIAIVAMLVELG